MCIVTERQNPHLSQRQMKKKLVFESLYFQSLHVCNSPFTDHMRRKYTYNTTMSLFHWFSSTQESPGFHHQLFFSGCDYLKPELIKVDANESQCGLS